jgi:hypothetical protein
MKKPEIQEAVLSQNLYNPNRNKISKEDLAKQIRKMREKDAEMVTGVFKNHENPAAGASLGILRFSYKKYHGEPNVVYELRDGERYRIPRGVKNHINNGCFYTEHQLLPGQTGSDGVRLAPYAPNLPQNGVLLAQSYTAVKKIHRFSFHSLDFDEDDSYDMPSNIVEVVANPITKG